MPEMDGYKTTKIIRILESNTNKHTNIIALTANALQEKEKCLAAGMDNYLAKPFNFEDLFKIIIER